MISNESNVDAYMQSLEPERRAALAEVRTAINEVVPEAVETMKYRMPTFTVGDHILCAFASQKRYMSLYMDVSLVDKHREELAGLNLGRSCIRFTKLEKLPLDTVRTILAETVEKIGASSDD
jgi:uncharacterized protein YdhG (YjbR/CyaY superfamily)